MSFYIRGKKVASVGRRGLDFEWYIIIIMVIMYLLIYEVFGY